MNLIIPTGDAEGDVLPFNLKLRRRQRARWSISVDFAAGDARTRGIFDFQFGEQITGRWTFFECRARRVPLAVVGAGELSNDEILCHAHSSQHDKHSDKYNVEAASCRFWGRYREME